MMNDFYTDIHDLNHRFFNETLNRYRTRIINELRFFGKGKNFFVGKKVLDIGTGFQGIVALEMGAESVIHVDINQTQLNLMRLYIEKIGISDKIKQKLINLDDDSILKIDNFDIGIIFGIINHLNNPTNAIMILQSKLFLGGELLIRAYDGSSTTRILINELRKLANGIDYNLIKKKYYDEYGLYANTSLHLKDLLDDLYSPIVNNFIIKNSIYIYNNRLFCKDENFRMIIDKHQSTFKFEPSTNNLLLINFSNYKFKLSENLKILIIIRLYDLVRKYKYLDPQSGVSNYLHTSYVSNDILKYILFFSLNFFIRIKYDS